MRSDWTKGSRFALAAEEGTPVTEGEVVQRVVEHAGFAPGSPSFGSISAGWPAVLSSLKSILETGRPLETLSACAA